MLAGDLDASGMQRGDGDGNVDGTGDGEKSWFVPAFSRDQTSKEYVTHGIRAQAGHTPGPHTLANPIS